MGVGWERGLLNPGRTMMSFNERRAFDHRVPPPLSRPCAFVVGAELKTAVGWGGGGSPQISPTRRSGPGQGEVSEFLRGPLDSISPDLPANPD